MPAPKRRAPRRTAAAIAEDLSCARRAGGLRKADETDLRATLDWLAVTGVEPESDPLARARDLLLHYTKRVCDAYAASEEAEAADKVAARSLERLLLRPPSDTDLAKVIRRGAAEIVGHPIAADALRHREDRLVKEIAEQAGNDLAVRRLDVPQTVEAAVHAMMPVLVDVRDELHDLLCVTYPSVPPADAQERRVLEGYRHNLVVECGDLLSAASQLFAVGLRSPNLSGFEFGFVSLARRLVQRLFAETGDRDFMLQFAEEHRSGSDAERFEQLRAVDGGAAVYERWLEWTGSCFPTCAFERTTDATYMCSPHAFVTLLYDFEVAYFKTGYAELDLAEVTPMRHHRLNDIPTS